MWKGRTPNSSLAYGPNMGGYNYAIHLKNGQRVYFTEESFLQRAL
jgi:hypothetical protein